MIIGNQATGRWMKRSPFENAHVLADQLGNWLTGWKAPPKGEDYANAPKLRSIPRGEQIYRTRCATCHSLTGHELAGALGPDLLGVTDRREMNWILNWLRAPDQMLEQKDPIAMALYERYGKLAMPNLRLNQQEAEDIIDYMRNETRRIEYASAKNTAPSRAAATVSQPDIVAIMNAWIREADPAAKVIAGYMTFVNTGSDELRLVRVESDAFESVEIHEMSVADGMMKMQQLPDLVIPANGRAKLEPGGRHLMLRNPQHYFVAGETVDLTLSFESGIRQKISLKVAAR